MSSLGFLLFLALPYVKSAPALVNMDLVKLFQSEYQKDRSMSPREIMDICATCQYCCINGQCVSENECSAKYTVLIAVVIVIATLILFFFYRRRNQIDDNKSMIIDMSIDDD